MTQSWRAWQRAAHGSSFRARVAAQVGMLQPEPDVPALRARTEALAAEHPLYPHLSHDGAAR